jgi:hypothetical protein
MKLRWLVRRVLETKTVGNTSVGFKDYKFYREERVLQYWDEEYCPPLPRGVSYFRGGWVDVPAVTEKEVG